MAGIVISCCIGNGFKVIINIQPIQISAAAAFLTNNEVLMRTGCRKDALTFIDVMNMVKEMIILRRVPKRMVSNILLRIWYTGTI